MEGRQRNSIADKMLYGIIVFALIIIMVVGALICYGVILISSNHYREDTMDYARIAAHVIEGDRIAGYAETEQKDAYYVNTQRFLDVLCEEMELTRISVTISDGADTVYIWDAGAGRVSQNIGYRDRLRDGEKNLFSDVYGNEPANTVQRLDVKGEGHFIVVNLPLNNSQGEPVAVVTVIRPDVERTAIIAQFIFVIAFATILVSAIIMLIAYRLLRKNIIKPINKLTLFAGRIVSNIEHDEAIHIEVNTHDELETLADAFNKMDVDLRKYIKEYRAVTSEQERYTAEISIAAQIQKDMLPKIKPPLSELEEIDLATFVKPAKQVGGDFYDFFLVDDSHLALVMADVSGKGVPAALFMVVSKVLLKNSLKEGMSPAEALSNVNEKLLENNEAGFFVTVWLAVIDLETGSGIAANAGHEHPAFRRNGGNYELIKYRHSPAIATLSGLYFTEHEFTMKPGDSLFVFTDGVTEANNSENVLFGEKRLTEALNSCKDGTPEELLQAVISSIEGFVGEEPQFDDITMLALRYNGR